ncbi:DUF1127 domain-containing protein [Telmatospirillum siberiense]|uniref:YjiS-like domain-containing protein n=1 Tax=Telmatospirillum siberiense TaxID=382514 RepID=A0A2N3PVJ7_9PROT|nr:DUF1127 domain-containing protein [Telmatospirillum siberiense]PKU24436.1 hypothetical protein CWS72_11345 [Telmatospirillum siberiense]
MTIEERFRSALHKVGRLESAPSRLWAACVRFWTVRSARRRLAQWDDRMLHDIGISRGQIHYETSRPIGDSRSGM